MTNTVQVPRYPSAFVMVPRHFLELIVKLSNDKAIADTSDNDWVDTVKDAASDYLAASNVSVTTSSEATITTAASPSPATSDEGELTKKLAWLADNTSEPYAEDLRQAAAALSARGAPAGETDDQD